MTQEELKDILEYQNGKFYWKKTLSNRNKIGNRAGTITMHGYEVISIKGKRFYSHTLSYLYHYGKIPKMIDHINNNGLDNRIENLRECNSFQNSANKFKAVTNKTGYKGVHKIKSGKYRVQFQIGSTRKHLGYFDNLLEAKEAYNKEAILHHKEFAKI